MATSKRDVIAGVLLTLFALLLYLVLIPNQVEPSEGGPLALSPRLFCQVIAVLLFILSLSLVIIGFRSKDNDAENTAAARAMNHPLLRGGLAVIASMLYVLLIDQLGYFSATVISMGFFLVFFGTRSWKGIAVFLLVILPFIYLLFVQALKVVLPTGLII